MPRDVQPLDEKQWDYVQKCLHSQEPEFVEMRKKQAKIVQEAVARAGEMNQVTKCVMCDTEFTTKVKYRISYCKSCTEKLLQQNIWQ